MDFWCRRCQQITKHSTIVGTERMEYSKRVRKVRVFAKVRCECCEKITIRVVEESTPTFDEGMGGW